MLLKRATNNLRIGKNAVRYRAIYSWVFLLAAWVPLTTCTSVDSMMPPCTPVHYQRQICYFNESFDITLDGNFDEPAWTFASASWEQVDFTKGKGTLPENDADASFEFACVADSNNMYFAFNVTDNVWKTEHNLNERCIFYFDDSLEITIDQDSGSTKEYDGDDAQITVKALSEDDLQLVAGGCSDSADILRGGELEELEGALKLNLDETSKYCGFSVELSVPLKTTVGDRGWDIVPYDGNTIGFQAGFNDRDNDDAQKRDHKLIWGKKDQKNDLTWTTPAYLETLEFCHVDDNLVPGAGADSATADQIDTEMFLPSQN